VQNQTALTPDRPAGIGLAVRNTSITAYHRHSKQPSAAFLHLY